MKISTTATRTTWRSFIALIAVAAATILPATSASAARPTLSSDTKVVNFGDVAVSSSGYADVLVYNRGTDELVLTQGGFNGPFTQVNATGTCYWTHLPAGGSCIMRFVFNPTQEGRESAWGKVYFAPNYSTPFADQLSLRVTLIGNGV